MTLNENIRQLRLARNLSQVDLAKALGVTKQSISNWENNNIQPSIDMLIRLSQFFSVSTDYLLGLDQRTYIEISELTDCQLAHIAAIIDDIRGTNNESG
ncbi:MAG: helix-turn-helix domain-containing protein [Lachnospiraceae bacterium]|nr:helix-turn-helix domain-containing protein [Lachnospiraceae bacterium]